jgi:hypothetical protein
MRRVRFVPLCSIADVAARRIETTGARDDVQIEGCTWVAR